MTLRKRLDAGNLRHWLEACGEHALEDAMDLS